MESVSVQFQFQTDGHSYTESQRVEMASVRDLSRVDCDAQICHT